MHSKYIPMHWLAVAVLAAAVTACASIGRPEGGPRDETPPVFVSSNPAPGARNVNRQRIDLYFDENVQLEDAFNKVVVSPVQKNTPRVSANGRHVTVDLQDSLLPNTTYTIDFADAIKDLNEGNVLDGFALGFATGEDIDTLRISGMVLEARTLEPAQGMLVGVYSNTADSAISTLPLERIARTNQYGQFTIYNLPAGQYRIFAINDINRDYKWDRSEDIAFYDTVISPYVKEITVTDTLRSAADTDSLVRRQGVAYMPNDILLCWFNEGYSAQYLKEYKRPARRRFTINMAAAADSLPQIAIANGPHAGRTADTWTRLSQNATLDSLEYWITDPEVYAIDSLMLSVKYRHTDSIGLSWRTDTLKFFYKEQRDKKRVKPGEEADTAAVPEREYLNLMARGAAQQDVHLPVILKADQPIDTFDLAGVHLEMMVDTVWTPRTDFTVEIDTLDHLLSRRVVSKWTPGAKYRLTVDSAAVVSVYGAPNKALTHEMKVRDLDEYSNLTFNVTGVDSCGVVELLDKSDKVIAQAPVVAGKAVFRYLQPGQVYARLYIDADRNGKWDTGNVSERRQPEEVYYFPKKIVLKKNWDVDQAWNIYETPLDVQKPLDIKKNKPKLKKGEERARPTEDEEEDGNSVFDDFSPYSSARRNSSTGITPMRR